MTKYLNTKPGSIEEIAANMSKHQNESGYQDMFKKELEKAGKGIGAMTPAEKKAFFNKIDDKYKAKNEETINENVSQVQVKRDGKGNFNLMFKGKEIGYYHKSGSKYMVYYDNEDGDYNQSDEVSSEMQAKKLAYDNMNEKVSDKQLDTFHKKLDNLVHKTIGKSSDEKKEAVDNPYAVGMAQAMKSTGDKPPLKKSTITKAHDIAKSIEKDEKEIVDPEPKIKQESLQDAIKSVWQLSAEELEKMKSEAKYMKAQRMNQYKAEKDDKNKTGTADTGSKKTKVDVEPSVDYKN